MAIEQISVFVENKTGRLAEITEILAKAGIDLHAMSIADATDFGILRLIVSEPQRAKDTLKAADYVVSMTQVLAVPLEDTPGGLAKILRFLADAQISIEYLYAFIARRRGRAYVIIRVADNARAEKMLAAQGVTTAETDEIHQG